MSPPYHRHFYDYSFVISPRLPQCEIISVVLDGLINYDDDKNLSFVTTDPQLYSFFLYFSLP
jgi:hypothetical protein